MDSPSFATKSTNARFPSKPLGGATTRFRSTTPMATSCFSRSRATVHRKSRELTHFASRHDPPAPFHPAAAPVPDLVVEIDRRTNMGRHHPHFLSDARRPANLH